MKKEITLLLTGICLLITPINCFSKTKTTDFWNQCEEVNTANNENFANFDFWKSQYTLSNIDILEQRVENLKNENWHYDDVYKNDKNHFIYDIAIIKDDEQYVLRFTVWKNNDKPTDEDIMFSIKTAVVHRLLKEISFRQNIKVLVELYGGAEGDDYIKTMYNDFILDDEI